MKEKQVAGEGSSKPRSNKGGSKNRPRGHRKKKNSGKDDRNTCLNYGKKGHWAKDCRSPRKEKGNLTKEEDEESLLMAHVCELTLNPVPPQERFHLDEPRAHVFLGSDGDDE
jgi:hypothetical protein